MRTTFKHLPVIILSLLLFVSPQTVAAPTLSESGRLPLIDGGFWSLGPATLERFSDEDLADELRRMHGLGLRELIIPATVIDANPEGDGERFALINSTAFPVHPTCKGRNPLGAILLAAQRLDMRVYLGGLPIAAPKEDTYTDQLERWSSDDALRYRKELVKRFAGYASFAGYYIPIQPNGYELLSNRCDPDRLLEATIKVSSAVKEANPDLRILMPIAVYPRPTGEGNFLYASRRDLDLFWKPWVQQLEHVDAWLLIDRASADATDLDYAALSQRWARDLTHSLGKQCWTTVTTAPQSKSFADLVRSLATASRFADRIITLDYLDAFSPASPNTPSIGLLSDYQAYTSVFNRTRVQQPLTSASSTSASDTADQQ